MLCIDAAFLRKGVKKLMGLKRSGLKSVLVLVALVALLVLTASAASAEDSLQKAARINEGCLRCHAAQGLNTKFEGKTVSLYVDVEKYKKSMHGTMACTYCHTNIADYPHTNALQGKALQAQVNRECSRCHKDIAPMYNNSIHSQVNKDGRPNAFCSDCHGIHDIYKKEVPEATISHNKVVYTCANCHKKTMKQYEQDFHGKSVILGGKETASCVSCHGSHDIQGPDVKTSAVSKENTPTTCAKCHLYALDNFAKGKMHYDITPKGDGAVSFWTLIFFTWLTILVVAAMLVLILMELRRNWIDASKPDSH